MRFIFLLTTMLFQLNNAHALIWEEGIKEVTLNNPELSAAQNLLQSQTFQLKAAKSTFFPKVQASVETDYGTTALNTTAARSNSLGVSATENIFAGFSDSAKIDQAQSAIDSALANLQTIRAKVSYDYKSSYANLVYAEKYIKLTSDIMKRREANLRLVQLRFESGRENIGSLNLSKAYLAEAKYDHLIATNSLGNAQAELAKVLGRIGGSEDDNLLVANSNIPISSFPSLMAHLNFKELAQLTPDYQKAVSDQKSSKASVEIAKASFFPSLNLTESASRFNRDAGAWSNTWSVGAALSFPLFDGFHDYYSLKSSLELFRSSALSKKNIEDTTIVSIKNAYTKYIELIQKLEVDTAFVEAGLSRERIAKEKYNNGLLTFDEWDIIENDLIARQKSLVLTEKERVVAEALWEQVQGKGVLP